MPSQNSLSVIVQTENDQFTSSGIYKDGQFLVGINIELGLISIAHTEIDSQHSLAHKSIEILLDDMSLNLPGISDNRHQGGDANRCLKESIDNINEYLVSQSMTNSLVGKDGIELVATQVQKNFLNCFQTAKFSSLQFSANRLQNLLKDKPSPVVLGLHAALDPEVTAVTLESGDILLLTSVKDMQLIGEEFLRVTLSRFSDNLEMLLRQINTRALHNGLKDKPVVALCRLDKVLEEQRGWLGKFRK